MKPISLFLTLFLLAVSLSAQRSVVADSSWITNTSGTFFESRYISYDNGEAITTVIRLGDTVAVANQYRYRFQQRASSWAYDVVSVSNIKGETAELVRQSAAIETLLGVQKNPLKMIAAERLSWLTDTAYVWKIDTSFVTFSTNAAGQLRYKVGSGTNKNAYFFGSAFRLINYTGTKPKDLFKFSETRYLSLEGDVILRRVKNGANR